MQAAEDQYQRDRQRDAWMLANLLQPWSRHPLTLEDFWEGRPQMTKREKIQQLREARGLAKPPDG